MKLLARKRLAVTVAILASATAARAEPRPATAGTDFAAQVRAMFRVAACGGDAPVAERFPAKTIERHCRELDQDKNHHLMITRPRTPDDPAGKR